MQGVAAAEDIERAAGERDPPHLGGLAGKEPPTPG
jgi:hypothetical protein